MDKFIEYYSELAGMKGSYSPFIYHIDIYREEKDSLFKPILYHEFTHYIQNFTTLSGYNYFYNTLSVMLRSFSHAGVHKKKITLPLKNCLSMINHLKTKNPTNLLYCGREGCIRSNSPYPFTTTSHLNFDLYKKNCNDNFNNTTVSLGFISFDGFEIPLNEWVIKENMANVVSYVGENGSDALSNWEMDSYLNNPYKEYTIIAAFIDIYLHSKKVLELTYKICELALNMMPVSDTMYSCLEDIQTNCASYLNLTEEEIIQSLKNKINYTQTFDNQFQNFQKLAKEQVSTFLSLSGDNEFLTMVSNFYSVIIKGLSYRKRKGSFYMIFNDSYITSLTPIIGCPPIFIKNQSRPKKIGYQIPSIEHITTAYIMQFVLWDEKVTSACPFLNLCGIKKNKYCYHSCYRNLYKKQYEGCNLSNALLINGVKKEAVKRAGWLKRKKIET